jgi:hypothetical protein
MKISQRCPKCSGTRLYVCVNHQPDPESSNGVNLFRVFTANIPQAASGAKDGTSYRTHVGDYETWICAACGFTEWYARDPEHLLQKLSTMKSSGVRVVDSQPQTPFR